MHAIDVWAQHATKRSFVEPYFASLKRWTGQDLHVIAGAHGGRDSIGRRRECAAHHAVVV